MTLIELARLVRLARQAQAHYFRTRTQADLVSSKAIERELDRAVDQILDPPLLPFEREVPDHE